MIVLVPVLLLASTATAPTPPPDDEAPADLIELRAELFEASEQDVLADMPKFRPLCDDAGFPLVGNAVRKTQMYQPSSFCREVRKQQDQA